MSESKKARTYSIEFKEKAAKLYLEGNLSYQKLSEQLGMKNPTPIRSWVNKIKREETLESQTGKKTSATKTNWPRKTFKSVEKELQYVKAERDYLKKLYRSLYGKEWGAEK